MANLPESQLDELHSLIEYGDLGKLSARLIFLHQNHPHIVNLKLDKYGMSLLHLAVGFSGNETHVIKVLMDHGGDPNNTDCDERVSPLHLSVLYDFDVVAEYLLRNGGDPSVRDGDGKSCFDHVLNLPDSDNLKSILLHHISLGSISSIGSDTGRTDEFQESFMTCQTSASGGGGPVVMHDTAGSETDDSFVYEDVKRRRFGGLSTINEETSSVMNKLSSTSGGISDNCKKSIPPDLTTINSVCSESSENQDPNDGFMADTSKQRSFSPPMTHSTASTPSTPPSPTESAIDSLRRKMAQTNINIPITPTTYHAINKFVSPYTNKLVLSHEETVYSLELQAAIQDISIIERLKYGELKIEMVQDMNVQSPSPRKNCKSFYAYVLLDPRVTKRINFSGDHLKSDHVIKNTEKFRKFVSAIFYIGKGCGKRPIKHLEDAKMAKLRRETTSPNDKIQRILDIWKTGQGVIVHSFLHHVTDKEASVYEAAIIDSMGLKELANQRKGSYLGTLAHTWNQKQKNQFGVFALKTCFSLYAVSYRTIKEIFPEDV